MRGCYDGFHVECVMFAHAVKATRLGFQSEDLRKCMEAVEGIMGGEGNIGREEGDMECQRRIRYAVVIWFVTGDWSVGNLVVLAGYVSRRRTNFTRVSLRLE